jgi:hypothetical protein
MATVTAGYTWTSGETVTPAKLNSAAAPTVAVANDEITTAKILDANVTAAKLASNAVETAKILDANVTQAKLAANVAGTGPVFRARQSSAQTLSVSASAAKVNLQSEDIDTASCFDTSTSRFTPNVAGYYYFYGQFRINNAGIVVQARIHKNGSLAAAGIGADVNTSSVSDIIYMNGTTDYVELFAIHFGAASQTITALGIDTFFTGYLARAA